MFGVLSSRKLKARRSDVESLARLSAVLGRNSASVSLSSSFRSRSWLVWGDASASHRKTSIFLLYSAAECEQTRPWAVGGRRKRTRHGAFSSFRTATAAKMTNETEGKLQLCGPASSSSPPPASLLPHGLKIAKGIHWFLRCIIWKAALLRSRSQCDSGFHRWRGVRPDAWRRFGMLRGSEGVRCARVQAHSVSLFPLVFPHLSFPDIWQSFPARYLLLSPQKLRFHCFFGK